MRVAPIRLAKKVSRVSERCTSASASAPMTPTAAASVAVAQPKYIDPITMKTSAITGARNRLSLIILAKLIDGSGFGRSPGRR